MRTTAATQQALSEKRFIQTFDLAIESECVDTLLLILRAQDKAFSIDLFEKMKKNEVDGFSNLEILFKQINAIKQNDLSAFEQVVVEEAKLKIMQAVHETIIRSYAREPEQESHKIKLEIEAKETAEQEKKKAWWRRGGFAIFLAINLVYNVVSDFFGYFAILLLIPHMLNPIALTIAAVLTIISTILYVSFDGAMLGDEFGIKYAADKKKVLECRKSQVEVNKNINHFLQGNCHNLLASSFIECAKIAKQFNKMIMIDKQTFTPKKHVIKERIYKVAVALGAVMTTGAAVGATIGLVALLATVSVVVPPLGFLAIVVVMGVGMLGTFFFVTRRGIRAFLMPTENEEVSLHNTLKAAVIFDDKQFDSMLERTKRPELSGVVAHEYKATSITQHKPGRRYSISSAESVKWHAKDKGMAQVTPNPAQCDSALVCLDQKKEENMKITLTSDAEPITQKNAGF